MAVGTPDNDFLYNSDESNEGFDGNDWIVSGFAGGPAYISGDNGNDFLAFLERVGDDTYGTILGGYGDDHIVGKEGDDWLLGHPGSDFIESSGDPSRPSGNDQLDGGGETDGLYGYDGDDFLIGGQGDDTRISITITVHIDTVVTFFGGLYGGTGSDQLYGVEGNDWLDGGAGSDKLYGGTGDDVFVVDEYATDQVFENVGEGYDVVIATNSFALVEGQEIEELQAAAGAAPVNLTGNNFAQTLHGNDGNNSISTGGGADTAYGRGGSDTLHGSGGDKLYVGAGDDYYYLQDASALPLEIAGEGRDSVGVDFSYKLAEGTEIEELHPGDPGGTAPINLTGNTLAQAVIGNDGNNVISDGGAGGKDILQGRGGNDTYLVYNSDDLVGEWAGQGKDRVAAGVSFALGNVIPDVQYEIEILTTTSSGGTASINLTGNVLKQDIAGNAGANILSDGGAGAADTMTGLGGNDTYIVYNSGDVIVEAAAQGTADRVAAGVDYALKAGVYVEHLTTTASSATTAIGLTGNALKQEIIGNAGANVLHDGGAGAADTLKGLGGNDTYRVFNAGDTIVEGASQGANDLVMAAVDYVLTAGAYIERLATNGTSGIAAIDLTGNDLAQEIVGNAGANILSGKGGNDVVKGLGGKDTLTGGSGSDGFVFNTALNASTNVDTITDFNPAADAIQLENAVFTALTTPGPLAASAFRANTTGLAGDSNDRVIYETDTGKLFYDANGTGAGGGIHFATLTGAPTILAADFAVI